MLLLLPVAFAQNCPATEADLYRTLQSAEVAFIQLEEQRFQEDLSKAREQLACVENTLTAPVVATLHRIEALAAFYTRDEAALQGHFRGMLAAEPDLVLSNTLAPAGHPLADAFNLAGGIAAEHPFPLPDSKGRWAVDGFETDMVPSDRPYLLQTFDREGALTHSAMMVTGSLPILPTSNRTEVLAVGEQPRKSRRRLPLLVTAGASALVSGGFYAIAADREEAFWDPATPTGEVADLRRETNTYVMLSAGLGAVAIGTGMAAAFTTTW